jgi:hypothetical protein
MVEGRDHQHNIIVVSQRMSRTFLSHAESMTYDGIADLWTAQGHSLRLKTLAGPQSGLPSLWTCRRIPQTSADCWQAKERRRNHVSQGSVEMPLLPQAIHCDRRHDLRRQPYRASQVAFRLPSSLCIQKSHERPPDTSHAWSNLRERVVHISQSPLCNGRIESAHEVYARNEGDVLISTNTIEGYFSILKRGINGVYHHVGMQHLHRYLSEFDFRYNSRNVEDGKRSLLAIRKVTGKRLKFRDSSGRSSG